MASAAAPRPFVVDPAVLARIRPMQHRHAAAVAGLHASHIAGSTWARLGATFLTEVYRGLVDRPEFLAFVVEEQTRGEDAQVRGFIAGTTHGPPMMEGLLRRRWPVLLPLVAAGVARSPGLLPHVALTRDYFRRSEAALPAPVPGESLFCAVDPALRGHKVAGLLNKVLFDDLAARGHAAVKVTTEVANEAAHRQLTSWGFQRVGEFTFYGKRMVTFVLDLESSPRVEPTLRHPAV